MEQPTLLAFDIEANGFEPTEIFVVSILDLMTGDLQSYTCADDNIADGLLRLADADLACGHYVLGYDIPVIERLTDGLIGIDRAKVFDTCAVSMQLFPEMPDHKLRTWAEILDPDFPKGDHADFTQFSPAMADYCARDVLITGRLFHFLVDQLAERFADTKAA